MLEEGGSSEIQTQPEHALGTETEVSWPLPLCLCSITEDVDTKGKKLHWEAYRNELEQGRGASRARRQSILLGILERNTKAYETVSLCVGQLPSKREGRSFLDGANGQTKMYFT